MSQIRMQTQVPGARAEAKLPLDPVLMEEIQQVCVGGETFLHSYCEEKSFKFTPRKDLYCVSLVFYFHTLCDKNVA